MMNIDRGWSDSTGVVLRHRVVLWLEQYERENPGRIPTNSMVAEALEAPVEEVARTTDYLQGQGLAQPPGGGWSLEEGDARLSPQGKALAYEWRDRRASLAQRRTASRDAVLHWLYDQPKDIADATGFLSNARSYFYGERFTDNELIEAVDYLHNAGLVTAAMLRRPGLTQDGMVLVERFARGRAAMLLRPRLTQDGMACVERFDSSVAAWQDRHTGRVEGTSYNFTGNTGLNFAHNSPGAQQSVTMTTDARQQVLKIADALEQALPVLGLSLEDDSRTRQTVQELREVVETPEDVGRLWKTLDQGKRLAVAGSGQAVGAAIALMVEDFLRNFGLG